MTPTTRSTRPFRIYALEMPDVHVEHDNLVVSEINDLPYSPHPSYRIPRLVAEGKRILIELSIAFHEKQALLALVLGAFEAGVEGVIINIEDTPTSPLDDFFPVIDTWQQKLEDLAVAGIDLPKSRLFMNMGREIFNVPDMMFEQLHIAGLGGIIVPELYEPVTLMNLLSLASEYDLEVINTATSYTNQRQVKYATRVLPEIGLPSDLIEEMKMGDDFQAGIEFLLKFVEFCRSFGSNGLLITNPTPRVLAMLA